ncbi:MAG: rhodanese-like domain-containing protein [Agathobacter sp.]|nr:rhodanese-like domain-containing protein [Agathobacter sp.]
MTFEIVYPKDIERLRVEKRAILVDIRSRDAYRRSHWEGAINYPEDEVTDYTRVLGRKRMIILYCQHGGSSMQLARHLGRNGYIVGTVVGGYDAMKKIDSRH